MLWYRHANQAARSSRYPSFIVMRTMAIAFFVVMGYMTLLPPSRVNAQTTTSLASHEVMQAVVYDLTHDRLYTYNAPHQFIVASSMKVPIMLTFLDMIERQGRGATNHEMDLLRTMIENSNNNSASALYYGEIGGAAGVAAYMRRIGVPGLSPNPNAWGWSVIYPLTMVELLTRLYIGTVLTAAHRKLALYLMEHVEADQRGGVGDTAPAGATVALKDGWVIAPDGWWAVNSSGIVITNQDVYIISVYTRGEPTVTAGLSTIRKICKKVADQLH